MSQTPLVENQAVGVGFLTVMGAGSRTGRPILEGEALEV